MFRTSLAALALAATLALPVHADGLTDMSDAERAAFGAEVRAYLLENPQVLMEAIAVLEKRQAADQVQGDAQLITDNADELYNDGFSHVMGNPEGDVTIVEFLDYRCGYCKKAHPEVVELLAQDKNIRLIVKEFPILGEQSVLASRFALAVQRIAGEAAYDTMHDTLMTLRAEITEPTLRALADEAGLDADAVMAEMTNPEIEQIITRNHALGQTLKINGTPSFVFGDQMVRGYVPLDAMQQIVASLRAE